MSPAPTVNVTVLHDALDAARVEAGMSWRQLSKELGVSASTLSRMAQGLKPDVSAFVAMTTWLRMPAEKFYVTDAPADPQPEREPELVASLTPLLRARRDLSGTDVEYLQEVIASAARRFKAERNS